MRAGPGFAYRVLATSGLAPRIHRRFFPDRLSIVMYHAVTACPLPMYNWCFVSVDDFRRQMAYLKERFDIVSLADAPSRLARGGMRRPLAAVTFDDGYRNNYTCAFPVLREFGIPATIYLATDFIDSDRILWDSALYLAFSGTKVHTLAWGGRTYPLQSLRQRADAYARIRNLVKEQPQPGLLQDVRTIRQELGCESEPAVPVDSPFRMLHAGEIREMADGDVISFGGHTCGHCILSRQPPEVQCREIRESLARVEQATGRACGDFAYPNGRACDYDRVSLGVLEQAGVQRAVTTVEGPNDAETPPLEFRRYGIGANLAGAGFQLKVHHAPAWRRRGNGCS